MVSLCNNHGRILIHGVGLERSSVICAVGYCLGLVCEAVASTRDRVVHKHVLIAVQSHGIHFERTCRRGDRWPKQLSDQTPVCSKFALAIVDENCTGQRLRSIVIHNFKSNSHSTPISLLVNLCTGRLARTDDALIVLPSDMYCCPSLQVFVVWA